jgi:hypothetical protein
MNKISRRPIKKKQVDYMSPAPFKGINSSDSLAAMENTYSIQCVNFIAKPQGLAIRKGYLKWSTGFTHTPETVITYNNPDSTKSKLFAVSNGAIYDCTSAGPIGAAVHSGLDTTVNRWRYIQQLAVTSQNSYMIMVNGSDFPRLYDGTAWTVCSQVASPSVVGEMSTVDSAGNAVNIRDFNDVMLHQQRLWFVKNNSTKGYYLDVAVSGGQLYPFDFGPYFPRGGKLWKLASWSANTGADSGINSDLIAISDKGDIVMYRGTSPSDATTWGVMATTHLGSPTDKNCTITFADDLLYLSTEGIYPLSRYLQLGQLVDTGALTAKIAPTINELTATYGSTKGWQMITYPGQNMLLLNVPTASAASSFQFAMNTVTQGWTQLIGIPATSWALYNEDLYFGGQDRSDDNFVGKAFQGYKDGADSDGVGGDNIQSQCLTAFDPMSSIHNIGRLKNPRLIKPFIITGETTPVVSIQVNTDYNITPIAGSISSGTVTRGIWDVATWDSAVWGGSTNNFNLWVTPRCYAGETLALSIAVTAQLETMWVGTSWIIESSDGIL